MSLPRCQRAAGNMAGLCNLCGETDPVCFVLLTETRAPPETSSTSLVNHRNAALKSHRLEHFSTPLFLSSATQPERRVLVNLEAATSVLYHFGWSYELNRTLLFKACPTLSPHTQGN